MNRLLLVEDQPSDLKIAADTARSAGISVIESRSTLRDARAYLEKGLEGEIPLPDGIVLDLDLGYESGFELLRFWHSTPRLNSIPVLVWSILGQEQREICGLFKVNGFVSKWEGVPAFREALDKLGMAN
jgi:DNA-binding response OmpR family regulator